MIDSRYLQTQMNFRVAEDLIIIVTKDNAVVFLKLISG
jgi:hypothetical protein